MILKGDKRLLHRNLADAFAYGQVLRDLQRFAVYLPDHVVVRFSVARRYVVVQQFQVVVLRHLVEVRSLVSGHDHVRCTSYSPHILPCSEWNLLRTRLNSTFAASSSKSRSKATRCLLAFGEVKAKHTPSFEWEIAIIKPKGAIPRFIDVVETFRGHHSI